MSDVNSNDCATKFGDAVAIIGRPAYTLAGLAAAAEATRRAIADRAPVVYQAAMFDGRFVGFADFLVRDGERYRVVDTKLARSPKVTALLQLAAYADALAASGVLVAPEAELQLGDGTVVRYRALRPDPGLPLAARASAAAARRALCRGAPRCAGRTRGWAPVFVVRCAPNSCVRPTICCWSPACE